MGRRKPRVMGMVGAGLIAGGSVAVVAALLHQGTSTARVIERAALDAATADGILAPGAVLSAAELPVPRGDGVYTPEAGASSQRPITFAMMGDSTAVGYGCRSADELPGVGLARIAAEATGRPVRLISVGLVGSGAADLGRQTGMALAAGVDLVVITVGGNDIRDKVPPRHSAELLGAAVAALHAQHIPVVVGSCPDFGVIPSIPQPLRRVLRAWSHRLAHLQERAASHSGALVVPLGRLISPDFVGRREMFAGDGFHPSGSGYARAVQALAPAVLQALDRA